jgi:hypothetical protein
MSQIVTYTGPDSQTNNQLRTQTSSRSAAYDPVDKLRVSQPQALIDTDFEYGQQPTKWESINLQNNRQGAYYIPQISSVITNTGPTLGIQTTSGSRTVRVNMPTTNGTEAYTANVTPIFIQGATNPNINGWWLVNAVSAGNYVEFLIDANATATTNTFNPGKTYVYPGYFYSNCGFQVGANCITASATTTPLCTTTYAHGLNVGDYVYMTGFAGDLNVNGAWIVATTPTASTFTFTTAVAVTSPTNSAGQLNVYMRPAGWVESRPYDGGVAFSAGGTITNQQLIRQTRRYFRYQSGKGIQFSTGSSLQPTLFQAVLTASGTTVTVTTSAPHNLAAGTTIKVSGATPSNYNGTFVIATGGFTKTTFTYVTPASAAPQSTPATGNSIRVNPTLWYGAQNSVGIFDQQNGIFFQYDGQQLYAVVRNSTVQTSGYCQVTQGNATVTGVGTNFTTALTPGQFCVIRGQSYRVIAIASDTSLTISPEYRGNSYASTNSPNGGYIMSVTTDTRYARSTWFDPMDGTGPSGYTLDLTRMQMFYIDYSWYGAGSIRWGFRGKDGAVTYCNQVQNNNVQYEAYMRSGNLPSHYESSGLTPTTYLTASITTLDTTIPVADASLFNSSGLAKLTASGTTGAVEYVTYTGKTATSLTGCTRGVTGGAAATAFTYSATAFVTVEYASADSVPSISHWGSSVIMDGQFNDDKSLIFNYGMTTPLAITVAGSYALMAIRIAPSVDNGTTSTLGLKETINRMQLQLDSVSIIASSGQVLINLILNGRLAAAFSGTGAVASFVSPQQLTNGFTSSLAQIAVNGGSGTSATITGGESLAAFYVPIGINTLDLSSVRDLGNSILGGGVNNTVPTTQAGLYPDGPDVLYVVATTTGASNVQARLSWKEAQA